MEIQYQATPADHGQRAVDILVRRTGMSRLLCKKIRLYGRLLCNGRPHRMIDPVSAGDFLTASYTPGNHTSDRLKTVPGVEIRYLDDWLLAAAKPAGMVTHPTYLHEKGSLTDLLADYPLHPVCRLDRDTSGLVIIARNGHAHHVISSHPMHKRYLALLHGRLPAPAGLIRASVRRSPTSIMLREIHPDGAEARTIWQELRYYPASDISLVRYELLTGRTHQLRLHSQACGCPIVGDTLYGGSDREADVWDRMIGRQALHSASLQFTHPLTGRPILVTAPLPDDFRSLLAAIRKAEH